MGERGTADLRGEAVIVARARGGDGTPPAAASRGGDRFAAALRRASDPQATPPRAQSGPARLQPRADRAAQDPGVAAEASLPLVRAPQVSDRSALASPPSVHRVAVAIEALRAGDRSRLELSFHDGAALRLDATPGGIAMTLAVAPALARVAAAELPALVAALRQRGVAVARAELRVRTERRPGGRSR